LVIVADIVAKCRKGHPGVDLRLSHCFLKSATASSRVVEYPRRHPLLQLDHKTVVHSTFHDV
jgi:hypothetical protein